MRGETIEVTTPDGVADAYAARPEGGAEPRAGVLLLMDAFGLRPCIEAMADHIAQRGYVVLAPNLFYRAGRAPVVPMENIEDRERRDALIARIMPLVGELTPERVASDGGAYLDWLTRAGAAPLGITGYCLGGRVGWQLAVAYPDQVAALGAFHTGGLVSDEPDSPHHSAGELAAEVYLGHADRDRHMTREHIAALEQALDAAGTTYRSELYEGAFHGYTMADTPVYDEAATQRHFDELFALLDRTTARRG